MVQQARLHREVLDDYRGRAEFPPRWRDMAELERAADAWMQRYRVDRARRSRDHGPVTSAMATLDRLMRTERIEFLDRDDTRPEIKVALVRQLHFLNRVVRSYDRFLDALRSHVERVAKREGRQARLLELASGSGEFTLALAAGARDRGLPVEVTGSDIVPAYVEKGNEAAAARGLAVRFIELNAFDMRALEAGAYDLVFIAQSMHHFSPGQLAMMIAQARRVAPAGFVGIDGLRHPAVLFGLSFTGLLTAHKGPSLAYRMWHDATVSARKFLPEGELELIARIAAPGDEVRVRWAIPTHTILEVVPHSAKQ